ncbi:beta-1,3-galactosyltransferase 2-like [Trichomycterus rosablanca]|uniref:beta-1,3-galactosyltransferase 2-like n=1 Tax=Trichomycterus rosablanca TaxID=2290929 RepID=UPI002F3527FD
MYKPSIHLCTQKPQTVPTRGKASWKCVLVFFLLVVTVIFTHQFIRTQLQGYPESGPWRFENLESYYVSYPHQYNFILDHPDKCSQHKPFMVVMVPVAPHQTEQRIAIRKTWGNDSAVRDGQVLVLFLLGLPSENDSKTDQKRIELENLQHQDILQSDFIDSYRNLTIKTMIMLEWLKDRCAQVKYAAKVDADMLLNITAMIKMLQDSVTPQKNYITGLISYENVVIRDPYNKFYIPPEVYADSVYPPYPLGMCYIISMDLPEKILQMSKKIKPIFIEDAYIGMCLQQLQIYPISPPIPARFVVKPPGTYNRCYYASLIAVITYNPDELISYWTDLHKPGPQC